MFFTSSTPIARSFVFNLKRKARTNQNHLPRKQSAYLQPCKSQTTVSHQPIPEYLYRTAKPLILNNLKGLSSMRAKSSVGEGEAEVSGVVRSWGLGLHGLRVFRSCSCFQLLSLPIFGLKLFCLEFITGVRVFRVLGCLAFFVAEGKWQRECAENPPLVK